MFFTRIQYKEKHMTYVDSIRELLEAKANTPSLRKQKIGLTLARRPNAVVPWQTMAEVNLFLAFQIKDLAVW